MAAVIEYAIRSKDQSQAGVKSAEGGVERLKKSVEGFSKVLTGTFLGGATLMAVRQIVQFGEASIKAAKDAGLLTPELDKINRQMKGLQVAIGTGLAEGLKGAFKAASEGIEILPQDKIATAVAGTIEKIGQAFKLLWDLVWTTGSGMFVRVFVFMAKVGLVAVKALFDAFKALFGQIGLIWENVAYTVKSVWAAVINWIIDRINDVLNLYNQSFLAKITGGLGQLGKLNMELGKAPGAVDVKKITAPFSMAFNQITDLTVDFGKDVVNSFKNIYADVLAMLKPPANVIIPTKPTVPGLPAPGYGNMPTFGAGAPPAPAGFDFGPILQMLLGGMGKGLSMVVQAIINPLSLLQPVFEAMFEILNPIVDSVLAPVIGALTIMGQALGKILVPILQALAPVIELLAYGFVFLYNFAIVPLGNAIIFVSNMIHNLIVGLWNGLSDFIKAITWGLVDLGRKETRAWNEGFLTPINMEDLKGAGASATGTGAGGTGATYTAAPIYNIYITNNFEVGSVIDSSGTWQRFIERVWNDGTLLEAARQGA